MHTKSIKFDCQILKKNLFDTIEKWGGEEAVEIYIAKRN